MNTAIGRPEAGEAAAYYFGYINQVEGDDALAEIEAQLDPALKFFSGISAEKSLHRYAPEKWSIRETLNHISDVERVFTMRALWFARGLTTPMPSFDQNVGVTGAMADSFAWPAHIEEFHRVRMATTSFYRNLPVEAWSRRGIASGNPFSVRATAYVIAGHLTHHIKIVRERYL
ncbi:MAG TPA: DinB family protein [Candidatus Acidoferrales bacterium]|nr:DinB family protein [Candidatus Acidoferrales bacterium]